MTTQTYDPSKTYIGLFGTCGTSTWRKDFIEKFEQHGIEYFNPQVDDWYPEFAKIEAQHLVKDDIILFPVTSETLGTGSLAESGFSIMQVLKSMNKPGFQHRKVILLIDSDVAPSLKADNPVAAKESTRARALVLAHLEEVRDPNVYIVNTMDELLALSMELYPAVKQLKEAYGAVNNVQTSLNQIRHKYEAAEALGLEPKDMQAISSTPRVETPVEISDSSNLSL